MTASSELLVNLLRSAVGNEVDRNALANASAKDWKDAIALSCEQAVSYVAVDGLDKFFEANPEAILSINDLEMDEDKYQWYGSILYAEKDYSHQYAALSKLAGIYASEGIKMMVLKGYANSLEWPVPQHRVTGDIDIYLFGDWKKGDDLISGQGIKVDYSHHHHSVFHFRNITVENHFDLINIHSHRSGRKIEEGFKRMADKSLEIGRTVKVGKYDIFLPSDQFNAVFLMRHMAVHFAAERMTLRQLMDWALFVRNHHQGVDWEAFWKDVKYMGMLQYVLCVNSICVSEFGFEEAVFHIPDGLEADSDIRARVLDDIFKPYVEYDYKGLKYIRHRLSVWLEGRWKHKLIYTDSLLSTFLYQIVSHLKKPASIFG